MEVSAKEKSKITKRKLFAFLRTTAMLEEKIEVASKILFQLKGKGKGKAPSRNCLGSLRNDEI